MKRYAIDPQLNLFAHVQHSHFATIELNVFGLIAHFEHSLAVYVDIFGARVTKQLVIVIVNANETSRVRLNAIGASVDQQQAVIVVLILVLRFYWWQIGL